MAIKTTVEDMKDLLMDMAHDLEKAGRGNKTAAQRVRTNSIYFTKLSKVYRKESVAEVKKGILVKKNHLSGRKKGKTKK